MRIIVEWATWRARDFSGSEVMAAYGQVMAMREAASRAAAEYDFLLSPTFQADIPLTMFVYPVIDVELPDEFLEYGARPEDPYRLDPEVVAENRDDWIAEWTEIVLR